MDICKFKQTSPTMEKPNKMRNTLHLLNYKPIKLENTHCSSKDIRVRYGTQSQVFENAQRDIELTQVQSLMTPKGSIELSIPETPIKKEIDLHTEENENLRNEIIRLKKELTDQKLFYQRQLEYGLKYVYENEELKVKLEKEMKRTNIMIDGFKSIASNITSIVKNIK